MVYVIGIDGRPLMPTNNAKARKLIKQKKAKVVKKIPFTIKLLYQTTQYTQNLTHGIDTGSAFVGSAVVDEKGNVVYLSEIEIRNDISDKMTQRRKYRRNRRNRKTRYRKAKESHGESHRRLLPITHLVLETATFDAHLLKNPKLKYNKWGYQKGDNYGFSNVKAFVLNRDGYKCQHCKGKSKDSKLEVHHIIYRSNGGGDEQENLITLCSSCHYKLHHNEIKLNLKGKKKTQLKHATQMNSIRVQLLRILNCEETFGFITKENRYSMGLPKEHYMDAVAIASKGKRVVFKNKNILFKKCVSDGDYQQSQGIRSEQRIPTCKIKGFRKFDKVEYLGKEYFIKGRMSTGYAILMDIKGNKIEFKDAPKGFKTPKVVNMKRLGARKTWIISQQTIQNIC